MSIPNYLYALANHKGPATITAGGMTIPVKIGNISHASERGQSDLCTFECLVVNEDQIRAAKAAINSVYGCNPKTEAYTDYVRRCLERSTTGRKRDAVDPIKIDRVIFNNPATIVLWNDGTKTVVKCQEGDVYSKETGLALCIAKKALGNKGNFNDVFHEWIPEEPETEKSEVSEKKEGCSYCGLIARSKCFVVRIASDLEIETVFNCCPVCGKELPKVF